VRDTGPVDVLFIVLDLTETISETNKQNVALHSTIFVYQYMNFKFKAIWIFIKNATKMDITI